MATSTSITFAYRSNTLTAYHAPGGESYSFFAQTDLTTLCQIIPYTATGIIGDSALDLDYNGLNSWVNWSGIKNTPTSSCDGMTVVYRSLLTDPTVSGADAMFTLGGRTVSRYGEFSCQLSGSQGLLATMRDQAGANGGLNQTLASIAQYYALANPNTAAADWTFKFLNTTTGLEVYVFLNGVTLGSNTFVRNYKAYTGNLNDYMWDCIVAGAAGNGAGSQHRLNEILIFDVALSDASIASTFTGPTRTSFYSVTVNTPANTVDPGIANVVGGVGYTIKGQSLTGTYAVATYTDPGVANVLSGTSYIFNNSTLTGTYHDPAYTDPGVANVANGTNYVFNDSTLTGTLSVPTPSTGPASTTPLGEIKEQIRYVLAVNNTSSGAPSADLSDGLTRRVRQILTVNPQKIPLLDNVLPALSVYTDSKLPSPASIALNGLSGKRKAEVTLNVVGMVWEPFTTDLKADPADNELEKLMENAERILRAYDRLSNNVQWHFPTGVTYHSIGYDERAHYRGAIMSIQATVYY